jgi:hypothetical protein
MVVLVAMETVVDMGAMVAVATVGLETGTA